MWSDLLLLRRDRRSIFFKIAKLIRYFLKRFSTSEHRIPLRQLRIDTSRSLMREGWQCDIPHVSDSTVWSVTRVCTRSEILHRPRLMNRDGWKETGSLLHANTSPRNATRERVENKLEGDRKTGEWNADSRMHLVTLPCRRFFKKFFIRRGNAAKNHSKLD